MVGDAAWSLRVAQIKAHIRASAWTDPLIYESEVASHFCELWGATPGDGNGEIHYLLRSALAELEGQGLLMKGGSGAPIQERSSFWASLGFPLRAGAYYEATPRLLASAPSTWSGTPSTRWPNVNDLFSEARAVHLDGHEVAAAMTLRAVTEDAVRCAFLDLPGVTEPDFRLARRMAALFDALAPARTRAVGSITGTDLSGARGALENAREVGNAAAHAARVTDPTRLELVFATLPGSLAWMSAVVDPLRSMGVLVLPESSLPGGMFYGSRIDSSRGEETAAPVHRGREAADRHRVSGSD